MTRRSTSMPGGTSVKIPEIFRAPEDAAKSKKRKQGGINDGDSKRRNTSCESETEEARSRRNSIAGPAVNSFPVTQTRKTSGLPVFNAKCKAGEAAPPEVVFEPNP